MFDPFERAIAFRYLRARKGERFVSVIATFSLVGIALGVATLIIVMSVMNGFRQELLGRILGLNGHLGVHGVVVPESLREVLKVTIGDVDAARAKLREFPRCDSLR
jgi:ABC-type lipoprotein release transport system permease subunit